MAVTLGPAVAAQNPYMLPNITPYTVMTLTADASATVNGVDQTNACCRGLAVYINITAIAAGSFTVTIQEKDPVSGVYNNLLASAALATTGFTKLLIYPGATVTANVSANASLPGTFRVIAATVTGPVTATVSAVSLP